MDGGGGGRSVLSFNLNALGWNVRRRLASPDDINPSVDVRSSICTSVNLHSRLTFFSSLFSSSSSRSDYPLRPIAPPPSSLRRSASATSRTCCSSSGPPACSSRRSSWWPRAATSGYCSWPWIRSPPWVRWVAARTVFFNWHTTGINQAGDLNSVLNITKRYPTLFSHLQNAIYLLWKLWLRPSSICPATASCCTRPNFW